MQWLSINAVKLMLDSKNLSGSPEKPEGSGAGSLVRTTVSCRACTNDALLVAFFVVVQCYCSYTFADFFYCFTTLYKKNSKILAARMSVFYCNFTMQVLLFI